LRDTNPHDLEEEQQERKGSEAWHPGRNWKKSSKPDDPEVMLLRIGSDPSKLKGHSDYQFLISHLDSTDEKDRESSESLSNKRWLDMKKSIPMYFGLLEDTVQYQLPQFLMNNDFHFLRIC
jgi:hypothetical protein